MYDQLQLSFIYSQRYISVLVRRCVDPRRSEWTRPGTITSTPGERRKGEWPTNTRRARRVRFPGRRVSTHAHTRLCTGHQLLHPQGSSCAHISGQMGGFVLVISYSIHRGVTQLAVLIYRDKWGYVQQSRVCVGERWVPSSRDVLLLLLLCWLC